MIICIIVLLFGIIGLNLFTFSLRLKIVDRVVVQTPKEIFESSIPLLTNDNKLIPIFGAELLHEKLNSYYTTNLGKSCRTFSFELYFYNPKDMSMCVNEQCTAVEVSVTAKVFLEFNYSKTIFYEIRKGAYGK